MTTPSMTASERTPAGEPERKARVYDPGWTIPAALDHVVRSKADRSAGFTFLSADRSEQRYTFAEIQAEALRRGRHLLARGLRKGDKIGLVIPEAEDFVLSFIGAALVGIVPVPMYPPLSFGSLDSYVDTAARILRASDSRMLLTTKKVQTVIWSLIDKVGCLEDIVTVEQLAGPAPGAEPETIRPEDVAFLQFTSGSTALPKGVVVSNRSLGANLHAIMEHGLRIVPDQDVAVSWLPLYHDMGLIGFMLAPLLWGVPTVYLPTLSFVRHPTWWMDTLSKYRGTIAFAPNFAFALATRRTSPSHLARLDLSSVRVLGCGAEPNHPGTLRAFVEHFAPAGLRPEALLPVYGMAEATLAMTFSRLEDPLRTDIVDAESYANAGKASSLVDLQVGTKPTDAGGKNGKNGHGRNGHTTVEAPALPRGLSTLEYVTCGWALPDHEVVTIDEMGNVLPDRVVGEIVFRGPSVAEGYYKDREATERTFTPLGLRTGDLGYLDGGELFVTGRKKDILILNGRNYDPQTVEWLAAEVDGVRRGNVVAFSVPGAQSEDLVVVAEVRPDLDREVTVAAVKRRIADELFLSVRDVVLAPRGTLPKTSSGKLQRARTRAQYLDGSLGGSGVRTIGDRGQALTVARHLAASMFSRVRHTVRSRTGMLLSVFKSRNDDPQERAD